MKLHFFELKNLLFSTKNLNKDSIVNGVQPEMDKISNYNICLLIGVLAFLFIAYSFIAYSFLETSSVLLLKKNNNSEMHTKSVNLDRSDEQNIYKLPIRFEC